MAQGLLQGLLHGLTQGTTQGLTTGFTQGLMKGFTQGLMTGFTQMEFTTRIDKRFHTGFTVYWHTARPAPETVRLEFNARETADVAEVVAQAILYDRHAVGCKKKKKERLRVILVVI